MKPSGSCRHRGVCVYSPVLYLPKYILEVRCLPTQEHPTPPALYARIHAGTPGAQAHVHANAIWETEWCAQRLLFGSPATSPGSLSTYPKQVVHTVYSSLVADGRAMGEGFALAGLEPTRLNARPGPLFWRSHG